MSEETDYDVGGRFRSGGMLAAILTRDLGLRAVVIEKVTLWRTSAISGLVLIPGTSSGRGDSDYVVKELPEATSGSISVRSFL